MLEKILLPFVSGHALIRLKVVRSKPDLPYHFHGLSVANFLWFETWLQMQHSSLFSLYDFTFHSLQWGTSYTAVTTELAMFWRGSDSPVHSARNNCLLEFSWRWNYPGSRQCWISSLELSSTSSGCGQWELHFHSLLPCGEWDSHQLHQWAR